MPNTHAAIKRVRADRKLHQRNLGIQSELKSLTRNFKKLISAKQTDQARTALRTLSKRLDQAVTKRILHRNTASRRKSRLSRTLARTSAS